MSQPSEHLEALKQAGLEDILWGEGSEAYILTFFGSIASGLHVEYSPKIPKMIKDHAIICNLSISYLYNIIIHIGVIQKVLVLGVDCDGLLYAKMIFGES